MKSIFFLLFVSGLKIIVEIIEHVNIICLSWLPFATRLSLVHHVGPLSQPTSSLLLLWRYKLLASLCRIIIFRIQKLYEHSDILNLRSGVNSQSQRFKPWSSDLIRGRLPRHNFIEAVCKIRAKIWFVGFEAGKINFQAVGNDAPHKGFHPCPLRTSPTSQLALSLSYHQMSWGISRRLKRVNANMVTQNLLEPRKDSRQLWFLWPILIARFKVYAL